VPVGSPATARRRARRRFGAPDADDLPDESGPQRAEPAGQNVDDRMPRAGSRGRSNVPIRLNGTSEETIVLPRPQLDRAKVRKAPAEPPRIIRQRPTAGGSTNEDEDERPGYATPSTDERTMVLPRAGAESQGDDGGGRLA
jgi:hypothetical protein